MFLPRFPMKRVVVPVICAAVLFSCGRGKPQASLPIKTVDFGSVPQGAALTPEFTVRNIGQAPLSIQKINITAPVKVVATKMPAQILPGEEGVVRLSIDTSKHQGPFDGEISLFLDDPALPEATVALTGRIVAAVELSPIPGFFVAVSRGERAHASVEIINHEPTPLRIEKVEHDAARFTTSLETLQDGQRYRLNLSLAGTGPGGHQRDRIVVRTSSKARPELTLTANTLVRERVYAFPDRVDFGSVSLSALREGVAADKFAQTVMVHRKGSTDFKVIVTTDVPGLDLAAARGPAGDRYQVTLNLRSDKTQPGPISGSLQIETNDREFPRLTIPISGAIRP